MLTKIEMNILERHKDQIHFAPYDGRTLEGIAQAQLLKGGFLNSGEDGYLYINSKGLRELMKEWNR